MTWTCYIDPKTTLDNSLQIFTIYVLRCRQNERENKRTVPKLAKPSSFLHFWSGLMLWPKSSFREFFGLCCKPQWPQCYTDLQAFLPLMSNVFQHQLTILSPVICLVLLSLIPVTHQRHFAWPPFWTLMRKVWEDLQKLAETQTTTTSIFFAFGNFSCYASCYPASLHLHRFWTRKIFVSLWEKYLGVLDFNLQYLK